jgi:TIR domain/von Willebrand factor type A domain
VLSSWLSVSSLQGVVRAAAALLLAALFTLVGAASAAEQTEPDPEQEVQPIRVVVLVDESGSLSKTDVQHERAAASIIATTELSPSSQVAIVGFGSRGGTGASPVDVVCPLTELASEAERAKLNRCVKNIHSRTEAEGNSTDFVAALDQAHAIMAESDDQNRLKIVFLLTDGKLDVVGDPAYGPYEATRNANAQNELHGRVLPDLREAGVQIWPLGFGDVDASALQAMAASGARSRCGTPRATILPNSAILVEGLAGAFATARCALVYDAAPFSETVTKPSTWLDRALPVPVVLLPLLPVVAVGSWIARWARRRHAADVRQLTILLHREDRPLVRLRAPSKRSDSFRFVIRDKGGLRPWLDYPHEGEATQVYAASRDRVGGVVLTTPFGDEISLRLSQKMELPNGLSLGVEDARRPARDDPSGRARTSPPDGATDQGREDRVAGAAGAASRADAELQNATIALAYSFHDAGVAEEISQALQRRGCNVWSAARIRPGDSWVSEVVRNLEAADVVLVLVSKSSQESESLGSEISIAAARELNGEAKIIPVLLDRRARLPFFLSRYQYFDLSNPIRTLADYERLAESIVHILHEPASGQEYERERLYLEAREGQLALLELEHEEALAVRERFLRATVSAVAMTVVLVLVGILIFSSLRGDLLSSANSVRGFLSGIGISVFVFASALVFLFQTRHRPTSTPGTGAPDDDSRSSR